MSHLVPEAEQAESVIYDNGQYFVEIGLPVKTPTLGMVYRVVNKQYNVIEDEQMHEHAAVQMADKLKKAKEYLKTPEYQASLIPDNRKH